MRSLRSLIADFSRRPFVARRPDWASFCTSHLVSAASPENIGGAQPDSAGYMEASIAVVDSRRTRPPVFARFLISSLGWICRCRGGKAPWLTEGRWAAAVAFPADTVRAFMRRLVRWHAAAAADIDTGEGYAFISNLE